MMMGDQQPPAPDQPTYVSRGGLKLHHGLGEFGIDPTGYWCADLGCSTGGFTDCLLRHGAARVFCVDTGYGVLDYRLRVDPRVTVFERANAMHLSPPADVAERGGVDLVTIDMSWTVQEKCLPAAQGWLKPGGRVVTLIKPHYEATSGAHRDRFAEAVIDGVLDEGASEAVLEQTLADIPAMGFSVLGVTRSPVLGGKPKPRKRKRGVDRQAARSAPSGTGNIEYLALLGWS